MQYLNINKLNNFPKWNEFESMLAVLEIQRLRKAVMHMKPSSNLKYNILHEKNEFIIKMYHNGLLPILSNTFNAILSWSLVNSIELATTNPPKNNMTIS